MVIRVKTVSFMVFIKALASAIDGTAMTNGIDNLANGWRALWVFGFTKGAGSDSTTFLEAIISELGQLPGTAEYKSSMKIWREFRGKFRT